MDGIPCGNDVWEAWYLLQLSHGIGRHGIINKGSVCRGWTHGTVRQCNETAIQDLPPLQCIERQMLVGGSHGWYPMWESHLDGIVVP